MTVLNIIFFLLTSESLRKLDLIFIWQVVTVSKSKTILWKIIFISKTFTLKDDKIENNILNKNVLVKINKIVFEKL